MRLVPGVIKVLVVSVLVLLLVSCGTSRSPTSPLLATATATTRPTPSPTPTSTFTPTQTATPSSTPTPTMTPTPTPSSPEALFNRYAPSLALVKTPIGSGTGVLIPGGYVLTNAHVVLPYENVRLIFPNKDNLENVPVFKVDVLADLVLLGPITTTLPAVTLSKGKDLPIGSELYLLGYPGEVEEYPLPTISKGLLSRYRHWDLMGLTFLQTDAAAAGGQSGGILVTREGQVVGILGYLFANQKYGIALEADDVQARVREMLDRSATETPGWVWVSHLKGKNTENVELRHRWSEVAFGIYAPLDAKVQFNFKGGPLNVPVRYGIYNPAAILEHMGKVTGDGSREQFTVSLEGPYYLVLMGSEQPKMDIAVESNVPLIRHPESAEDPLVHTGETTYGVIDYPHDVDVYRVVLAKDEVINVRVSSLMVDPILVIDLLDSPFPDESLVVDDNSGKGLFGTDAEITFKAPKRGTYALVVTDVDSDLGGYILTVQEPYEGAPTPVVVKPTPTPLPSSVGPMRLYRSKTAPYVLLRYPADWSSELPEEIQRNFCAVAQASLCLMAPYSTAILTMVEENLADYGLSNLTLDAYVKLWKRWLLQQGGEVIKEETVTTSQGLRVRVIDATLLDGRLSIHKLLYVSSTKGITVTFAVVSPDKSSPGVVRRYVEEKLPKIIRYVFSSFAVERQ